MDLEVWRTSSRNRQLRPLDKKKVWTSSIFSSVEGEVESKLDPIFHEPTLKEDSEKVVTQG